MRRTEKDVSWSDMGQINKCLWCGDNAIAVGPEEYMCINDPDCLAAKLEEVIEADAAKWAQTLKLGNPV